MRFKLGCKKKILLYEGFRFVEARPSPPKKNPALIMKYIYIYIY